MPLIGKLPQLSKMPDRGAVAYSEASGTGVGLLQMGQGTDGGGGGCLLFWLTGLSIKKYYVFT